MTWRVVVTPLALGFIRRIADGRIKRLVAEAISGLASDPEKKGKPLVGELAGYRALRAAGQRYRIIYRVENTKVVVVVVAVGVRREGDRKDIYSLAKRLFRQQLI